VTAPAQGSRPVDPNTPAGARRLAIMWTCLVALGAVFVAVAAGTWANAQVNGYTESVRGFNAGDPFPWVEAGVAAALSVFALVRAIGKWSHYRRLRRRG
jgi:hypothetical protein